MSKPYNETPPTPLEFITITDEPDSQKADFSYTIRSHAMQSFLHEKINPKPKQTKTKQNTASSPEAKTPRQLSGRFKLDSWSRKPRRKVIKIDQQREEVSEASAVSTEDEEGQVRLLTVVLERMKLMLS